MNSDPFSFRRVTQFFSIIYVYMWLTQPSVANRRTFYTLFNVRWRECCNSSKLGIFEADSPQRREIVVFIAVLTIRNLSLTKIQTWCISQINYVILSSFMSKGVSTAKNFFSSSSTASQYSAKSLINRTNSINLVFVTQNMKKKLFTIKAEINPQLPTIWNLFVGLFHYPHLNLNQMKFSATFSN